MIKIVKYSSGNAWSVRLGRLVRMVPHNSRVRLDRTALRVLLGEVRLVLAVFRKLDRVVLQARLDRPVLDRRAPSVRREHQDVRALLDPPAF